MARICLVSCVSKKANSKRKASELYLSPLFKKAKDFALKDFDHWYILSAKYGLLNPGSIIKPYDTSLNSMDSKKQYHWATKVYKSLLRCTKQNDKITFLAGINYRKHLVFLLNQRGNKIYVPMKGLGIGKQLKWLKAKTK